MRNHARLMFRLALYQVIKKNVTKNWRHKEGCLKLIRSFFNYHRKSSADKVSSKLNDWLKSYSCPNFNGKNSTKLWCHQWLAFNLLKLRSFNQVSSSSGHEIKSCWCSKNGKTFSGLQAGVALMISNRGKKITSQDSDLKWGQRNFKSGQRLQIVVVSFVSFIFKIF